MLHRCLGQVLMWHFKPTFHDALSYYQDCILHFAAATVCIVTLTWVVHQEVFLACTAYV